MAYNVLLRREPDEPAWTEQAEAMGSGDPLPRRRGRPDPAARASSGTRCPSARPASTALSTPAGQSSSSGSRPQEDRRPRWRAHHRPARRPGRPRLSLRLRRTGRRRSAARRSSSALPFRALRTRGNRPWAGPLRVPLDGGPLLRGRRSVDLVYSGQSIEHVSEADGDVVLAEAARDPRAREVTSPSTPRTAGSVVCNSPISSIPTTRSSTPFPSCGRSCRLPASRC